MEYDETRIEAVMDGLDVAFSQTLTKEDQLRLRPYLRSYAQAALEANTEWCNFSEAVLRAKHGHQMGTESEGTTFTQDDSEPIQ